MWFRWCFWAKLVSSGQVAPIVLALDGLALSGVNCINRGMSNSVALAHAVRDSMVRGCAGFEKFPWMF